MTTLALSKSAVVGVVPPNSPTAMRSYSNGMVIVTLYGETSERPADADVGGAVIHARIRFEIVAPGDAGRGRELQVETDNDIGGDFAADRGFEVAGKKFA